jgi:hypothetical protein
LRRVRIGSLGLDRAVELPPPDTEGWHPDELIPPEAMPLEPPDLTLHDAASAERFRHGGLVELPPGGQEGEHRVLAPDGRLLGVGDRRGGRLQPRVVLPPGGPG